MIDITTASKIRGIIEDAFTLEGNRNFLENYNGNQDELNEFLNIAMQAFEKKNITNNRLEMYVALEHALQFIGRCPFTRNKELELEISQVLAKVREDAKQ